MKRAIFIVQLLFLLMASYASAASFIYSENFTQGTPYGPGSPQYDDWVSFLASLDTNAFNFTSVTISGTYDTVGVSCSDPTIVNQIAAALRNGTDGTWSSNSRSWQVGDCVGMSLSSGVDYCGCGTGYCIRPGAPWGHWGGVNTETCGGPTQTMTVDFEGTAIPQITPPSSLTAKADSSTQIVLGWEDNSDNEIGFKIESKVGDCTSTNGWTQIATEIENATMHTVSGLHPNTTYAFRVRAYDATEDSDYSNCTSAKTGARGTPPSPTNLTATSILPSAVNLSWSDNSTNEFGFNIYRKAGTRAWRLLGTTRINAKTFSDYDATGNNSTTTYQYYVVAFNEPGGNSPSTDTAIVPFGPTNLLATKGSTAGTIELTWTNQSTNETGFEVYRQSSPSPIWTKVATLVANTTTWNDTGRTSGRKYAYKIRAYIKSSSVLSAYGYSMYSNSSSAMAP